MAFGNCRFLYDNVLEGSTITVSDTKTGLVSGALKEGTGSATATPAGVFTGTTDLEYTAEIDALGTGEIGSSTFKWKDGGDTWDATGVATSATAIALNNGVTIKWTAGAGADFVLGDTWYWKAVNRFSPSKMLDRDRDTRYRGTQVASAVTFVFDMSTAQTFDCFAIMDHNFSSGATITLEANATDSWGSPSFTQSITYNADKILTYFNSQSYRYIRLSVTDISNSDGYLEISELFAGEYLELSKTFAVGHSRDRRITTIDVSNRYGVTKRRFFNKRQAFTGVLNMLPAADVTSLETMLDDITDVEDETIKPIYFNIDSELPNSFWLMHWDTLSDEVVINNSTDIYRNVSLELLEVAKSLG